MRLRQVVLVAGELAPVVEDLRAVLGLGAPYADPGIAEFGLANAVLAVGDTFLEVVSPIEPGPGTAAGRHLARLDGDGGYMAILQSDRLDDDRARVAELGVRVVWRADLPDIRGTHLHPKDVGGAILSLDDADPPESWRWAGPAWKGGRGPCGPGEVTAIELAAEDPVALAERWSLVLDRPDAAGVLALERGAVRFVGVGASAGAGRRPGLSAVEVAVEDPDAVRTVAADRGLPVDGDGRVGVGGVQLVLVGSSGA